MNFVPAMLPRNAIRSLSKYTSHGYHAFRRFRATWLSEMECNRDVKIYWMGWSSSGMSDLYSKLSRKIEARLKEAERIGVGFDLSRQIVKVA